MEGMFEIEVIRNWPRNNAESTIAVSIAMGIRISEDETGCWISLADNSLWKSAHDYRTTVDTISGILRHL